MEPKVSIIVNNYNYANFVREAIESALAQTYANCEVIVVDDGSTDDSRLVIQRFADKIKLVLKENGGQGSAFNAGFAHSSGEIIFFLDADDYLYPDAVSKVVANWRPDLSKLQFSLDRVDSSRNILGRQAAPNSYLHYPEYAQHYLSVGGQQSILPTSGNAWSRAMLQTVLPMPEAEWRICADGYLLALAPLVGSIASLAEPLAGYRVHGNNGWATGGRNIQWVQKNLAVAQKQANAINHFLERNCPGQPFSQMRSIDHVLYRAMSLRLNPQQHPFREDTTHTFMPSALRVIFTQFKEPLPRRLAYLALVGLILLVPRSGAERLTQMKIDPSARPDFAQKLLRG